nr:CHAT domain-containing protein [Saprospiraceae bacterium]
MILHSCAVFPLLCAQGADPDLPVQLDEESRDSILLEYYRAAWEDIDSYDYPSAIAKLRRAKQIVNSHSPPDLLWLIDINEALGFSLTHIGRLKESLSVNYEITELAKELEDEETYAFTLSIAYNSIAIIYSQMHFFELAMDYYSKALYIDSKYFPDNREFHYMNHRNIGIASKHMGDYETAKIHLRRAMEYLQHPAVNSTDRELALTYNFLDLSIQSADHASAHRFFKKAANLRDQITLHPEMYIYGYELTANYYLLTGDTTAALKSLREAQSNAQQSQYSLPFILCKLYSLSSRVLMDLGETDEAIELLNHCLDLQLPDPQSPPDLIDDPDAVLRAKSSITRARFLEIENRGDLENKTSSLKELLLETESQIEMLKSFITSSLIPHSRTRLVADHMTVFETGMEILYHLYRLTGKRDYVNEAILLADQSRSILLLEDMVLKITADEEIQAAVEADRTLKITFDSLALLLYEFPAAEEANQLDKLQLENQLAEIRIQRQELFANSLLQQPQYLAQMIAGRKARGETIEHLKKEGITLLTHFFGKRNFFVLSTGKRGVYFEKKDYTEKPREKFLQFRQEIEKFPSVIGNSDLHRAHLEKLFGLSDIIYNQLVGGAAEYFTDHLCIIAVDETSVFPFGALIFDYSPCGSVRYLIEEVALTYTYSLKTLELILDKSPGSSTPARIVAFAPDYGNDEIEVVGMDGKLSLSPLVYNREEAILLKRELDALSFIGPEATVSNFNDHATHADILHLSGHAFSNDNFPQYSFFAFNPDSTRGYTSLLPISDIENLKLQASMVFLNGCRTGYGPIQKGEGALSLQRAFASAGVNSMVTTLWPIDDGVGYGVASDFYTALKKGNDLPQSIRHASLELISKKDPIHSHPYFWSSHVSYGHWENPLAVRNSLFTPGNIISLGLLLLTVVVIFLWRKKHYGSSNV